MLSAKDWAFEASMSAMMTLEPSLANRRAVSAPMPCPPPVMIVTWPARRPLGKLRWERICSALSCGAIFASVL